jgi:hypothetical protein
MQKASESYLILCFTHHYDETARSELQIYQLHMFFKIVNKRSSKHEIGSDL